MNSDPKKSFVRLWLRVAQRSRERRACAVRGRRRLHRLDRRTLQVAKTELSMSMIRSGEAAFTAPVPSKRYVQVPPSLIVTS